MNRNRPRTRRALAVFGSVGVAFLLLSCGVDAGDAATSSSISASEDLSPAKQAMVERATKLYVDLGLDPDDAECLARGIVEYGGTLDPTDSGQMMDIVNECDIPISELNQLGKDQGLTSMEDGVKFGLEASLKDLGLTDEEASCVADAFVEEYGTDVSAGQDLDKMRPIFEGCDVDPTQIGD